MLESNAKIYIAGHSGLVGSAINRNLEKRGYTNIIRKNINELNLIDQRKVESFFFNEKPQYVIIAAARVGGILANNLYRAEFIYENIMITSNIIHAAYTNGVRKLIFLGSSCIYPKLAKQPLKEEYLLTGPLETTNEPYAIAKIAGLKLCENYFRQYGCNFFSVMPTNLYGPYDNFDLNTSHVIAALIRKFHEAKLNSSKNEVVVWGSGRPLREFLYVEDLADAIHFFLDKVNMSDLYEENISHINIGTGREISIDQLSKLIAEVIGFRGNIKYDRSKPDGTPRKVLDVSRLNNLGWRYQTSLKDGLEKTYQWYFNSIENTRIV
jgi:GDP-L-fucose synthase